MSFYFLDSSARSAWLAATTQQAQLEGLRDEWSGQMSVRYYSAADAHLATVTYATPIVDTTTTPRSLRLGAWVAESHVQNGTAAYCILAVPAGADILRADVTLAGAISDPGGRVRVDIGSKLRIEATSTLQLLPIPAWRSGQTPLTWAAIGTSVAEDVDPENNAALNPNYPGIAPWRNTSGGGDIFRAWTAWGTGVWHESTGKFRIPAQGGHDDYAGNEVYLQRLTDDDPQWELERAPTGAIGNTGTLTQTEADSNSQVYFDGRPRSHHGYGMFTDRLGDVWSAPNGPFKTGGNNQTTFKLFKFAESTSDWTTVSSDGFPVMSNAAQGAGSMCWDETRDRFYVYPSANIPLSYYDVQAGTATALSVNTDSGQYSAAIRIPELDIIVFLNHGYSGDLGVYDYGRNGTVSLNQPGATGTPPTYAYANSDWYPNGVWVPGWGGGVGAIFCWHGGEDFSVLTPPASGDPATTAWAWSTVSAGAANALNPGNPNSAGVWGRLFYSARLNGIGLSLQPDEPTYFFALE